MEVELDEVLSDLGRLQQLLTIGIWDGRDLVLSKADLLELGEVAEHVRLLEVFLEVLDAFAFQVDLGRQIALRRPHDVWRAKEY